MNIEQTLQEMFGYALATLMIMLFWNYGLAPIVGAASISFFQAGLLLLGFILLKLYARR